METYSTKPKRHRRTKAEMEAARALLKPGAGKHIPDKVKSSEKSSTAAQCPVVKQHSEVSEPILKPRYVEYVEGKVIEGWVNVYKDGKSYWLGSDIHYTIEEAKNVLSKYLIGKQIKVSFEEF